MSNEKQSTSRRKKSLTTAEKSLTYAERLELLESIIVLIQDVSKVYVRQNGHDIEIKIKNAKLEGDTIVPNNAEK